MFVRHGETVGNSEQIAHGQTESPLNDRGIQQAEHTAAMLKTWDRTYQRVYASPLSRAHQTGGKISQSLALPLHTHDGLMEGFLGDWEGITYRKLAEVGFARRSIEDDDFEGHNGESPNRLAQRMVSAITEIRETHPGENIIIVSHGAAIAHALSILLGTKASLWTWVHHAQQRSHRGETSPRCRAHSLELPRAYSRHTQNQPPPQR